MSHSIRRGEGETWSVFRAVAALLFVFSVLSSAGAGEFSILKFGATPNDDKDDTLAIAAAFKACGDAGGGVVRVPAGTFIVARQASESPILELPSQTILRGEGPVSVLKFDPRVNKSNFWRMLGARKAGCRHVTVCDLRLNGSNTHPRYEKGQTPEQNHGVFLWSETGVIEDVCLRDLLVEGFSGDGIAVGRGCRNITIRHVTLRNFLRQGIQLGGDENARDYLVTGCQDLEHSVEPGGSTIHVEHARGLRRVIISGNRCRQSILAGGVNGLILRDNVVDGRIEGNGNSNAIVQGNVVFARDSGKKPVLQFGYAAGLVIKDNVIVSASAEQTGIYVWGSSRYNPEPSRQVLIADNLLRVRGQPISLNGVHGGLVRDNLIEGSQAKNAVDGKRLEGVELRESKRPGEPRSP
jgi:hypothetical protein